MYVTQGVELSAIQQGELDILDSSKQHSFFLGVNVSLHPTFKKTKVVTLAPRYLLVNKSDKDLYVKQVGASRAVLLPAGSVIPFHWNYKLKHYLLSISYDMEDKWGW